MEPCDEPCDLLDAPLIEKPLNGELDSLRVADGGVRRGRGRSVSERRSGGGGATDDSS
jgi:hypothetical protein